MIRSKRKNAFQINRLLYHVYTQRLPSGFIPYVYVLYYELYNVLYNVLYRYPSSLSYMYCYCRSIFINVI